jgi:ATP-dependent Clp protease ATP-binding subunit ClpA
LEGLLLEDPQLFNFVLPEKPDIVKVLKDELATWREQGVPKTEKKDMPLSPTGKEVVVLAGTEQQRLGQTTIATQHLLLALLKASKKAPTCFRKGTQLRVQELLSRHGITAELTEEKTKAGIITPASWVLDDRVVALNAQIAGLAELLIEKRIFTRAEFVSQLDHNDGPLVPEAFLLPLMEALSKKGILTTDEQRGLGAGSSKEEGANESPTAGDKNNPAS